MRSDDSQFVFGYISTAPSTTVTCGTRQVLLAMRYYQLCMFTGLARLLQLLWTRWFKFAISFRCSICQTFAVGLLQ